VLQNLMRWFLNGVNKELDTDALSYATGIIVGLLLLRFFGVIALFSFLLGVVVCIVGFILFHNSPAD
jgi:hypothetical protein